MKDKELEEQLKAGVDKIELNDFSTVWENMQERWETEENIVASAIPVASVALANNNGTVKNKAKNISIFVLASIILIGVILAIVLPLTLKKTVTSIKYHSEEELSFRYVIEEEFYSYNEISELNLLVFPFEKDVYELIVTQDDSIKGGRFNFFDESTASEGKISFYDKSVIFNNDYKKFKNKIVNEKAIVYFNEKGTTNTVKSYEAVIEMEKANYKLDIKIYENNSLLPFIEMYFN